VDSNHEEGSALVEAAIVFPLVILTVLTMIYIMIFMYAKVASSCGVQMATRKEAGETAGTVMVLTGVPGDVALATEIHSLRKCIAGEKQTMVDAKGLVRRMTSITEGRSYVLDEKMEIRLTDFVGESMDLP